MKDTSIAEFLINWYTINKRDLPWRHAKNPYIIWISEIILQQTRVVQGMPYFYRFTEQFPDVYALANADQKDVLKCWEGLGYYSRARNMQFTAKFIVENLDGIFPQDFDSLLKLKGIGNYTAAAIASFAFGEKVAVLDGNVMRVLARLFDFEGDINDEKNKKILRGIANELIPANKPAEFNQAIMEFGALHCVPANPKCGECVLAHICLGFKNKKQHVLPYKSKKLKVKTRYFNYLVLRDENENFYIKRREKGDIWQGLHDFALVETTQEETNIEAMAQKLGLKNFRLVAETQPAKHILTHQLIYAKFWTLEIPETTAIRLVDNSELMKCNLDELKALPKPILIKNFLDKYFIS